MVELLAKDLWVSLPLVNFSPLAYATFLLLTLFLGSENTFIFSFSLWFMLWWWGKKMDILELSLAFDGLSLKLSGDSQSSASVNTLFSFGSLSGLLADTLVSFLNDASWRFSYLTWNSSLFGLFDFFMEGSFFTWLTMSRSYSSMIQFSDTEFLCIGVIA